MEDEKNRDSAPVHWRTCEEGSRIFIPNCMNRVRDLGQQPSPSLVSLVPTRKETLVYKFRFR